jgi:hypothetical protein
MFHEAIKNVDKDDIWRPNKKYYFKNRHYQAISIFPQIKSLSLDCLVLNVNLFWVS